MTDSAGVHYIRLCYCGIVLVQCRCPGPLTYRSIGPKTFCRHTPEQIDEAKAKGSAHWQNPLARAFGVRS